MDWACFTLRCRACDVSPVCFGFHVSVWSSRADFSLLWFIKTTLVISIFAFFPLPFNLQRSRLSPLVILITRLSMGATSPLRVTASTCCLQIAWQLTRSSKWCSSTVKVPVLIRRQEQKQSELLWAVRWVKHFMKRQWPFFVSVY